MTEGETKELEERLKWTNPCPDCKTKQAYIDKLRTALSAMVTHNEKEHRCHCKAHRMAVHVLKATAGKGEVRT